ncbi:MAG: type III-B CRISPR module RAMP protein Cmr6 [Candidatus Binatia bacterium]
MEYPIPRKSADAWRKHQGKSNQNPGLIFDRFAPLWEGQATLKKEGLDAVRRASERGKVDERLLTAWNTRWEKTVRHANADPFTLKTDWRFITGLGRKGSLEVGFTFHRYGFPMLPGSSVKGIARAWSLISLAMVLDTKDLSHLDETVSEEDEKQFSEAFEKAYPQASSQVVTHASEFRQLFGTTGAAGCAIFFDAIPRQTPKLELDVMTPHYPDYYGDKNNRVAPTDSQSPIPVYFLTVAPNVEFRFAVGWRGEWNKDAHRLRALVQDWLIKGLTELGAGAKTSAGYGYFVSTGR